MIVTLLLGTALLVGVCAHPIRTRLADDDAYTDTQVRAFDIAITAILVTLFGVAAVFAARSEPVSGTLLAAAQVTAVVAVALSGGYVVRAVLSAGDIPTRSDNYDDPQPDPPLRGGRVIGVLERIGVAVCLLAGWPAGIAVILGVKGLARFPQLREHHASEQFIIGTFASVLWAGAGAGIVLLLAA